MPIQNLNVCINSVFLFSDDKQSENQQGKTNGAFNPGKEGTPQGNAMSSQNGLAAFGPPGTPSRSMDRIDEESGLARDDYNRRERDDNRRNERGLHPDEARDYGRNPPRHDRYRDEREDYRRGSPRPPRSPRHERDYPRDHPRGRGNGYDELHIPGRDYHRQRPGYDHRRPY